MEKTKLRELLDEYIELIWEQDIWEIPTNKIISKSRGFIKWLVENDKIDDKKVQKSDYLAVQYDSLVESYKADELIMLLAISDTPIEDLISYLK